MATKMTPLMYARGTYELKSPWSVPAKKIYTCIAIRSFEDIYKQNEDVYTAYYKPYIIDGSDVNGTTFSFATEAKNLPNIVTLRSEDNELIYVPDTYISSYPKTDLVPYSNVVVALGFGPLPDELDLSGINQTLIDNVKKYFGVTSTASIMRLPLSTNPTSEEHTQNETLRLGAITSATSLEEQLEIALGTIDKQKEYIATLEASLQST